jgi:hypothetical protein
LADARHAFSKSLLFMVCLRKMSDNLPRHRITVQALRAQVLTDFAA